MTNLREKYAEVIANMIEDAKANVAEATANVEQRVKEQEAAKQKLEKLTGTATSAHSQFKEAGKNAQRYAKETNPNVDLVEKLTEPFHTYTKAMRQIPDATYELECAEDDLFEAKVQRDDAEYELNSIAFFAIAN